MFRSILIIYSMNALFSSTRRALAHINAEDNEKTRIPLAFSMRGDIVIFGKIRKTIFPMGKLER